MARTCPSCHIPLMPITVKGNLKLDACQRCHGIWFDKDELSQTFEHEALPESLLSDTSAIRDKIVCDACGTSNPRSNRRCSSCGAALDFLCPACHTQMEEVPVGNVLVDRCDQCHGVWLDGGELNLLFQEVAKQKQAEIAQRRQRGERIDGDLAAWAAIESLDALIWTPYLLYHLGDGVADAVTELPGAIASGAGAVADGITDLPDTVGDLAAGAAGMAGSAAEGAADFIGDMPEMAGDLADDAMDLAGGAADMAGNMLEGTAEFVGDVPEIAGSVAEAAGSFIEIIFDIIGSIFDN